MSKIYVDNAATTPVDKKVLSAMKKYWRNDFGNPSSIHSYGVKAKKAVEKARGEIAGFLNAHAREIVFTSGGTEANNLAVEGVVNNSIVNGVKSSDIHIVTTKIEHSSVLEVFKKLERFGVKTTYLDIDKDGLVNPKNLREVINDKTVLVSIGYANSEIGTIQPIKEIIKEIRHARKKFGRDRVGYPYLHLDASQAAQYLNMNVEELGVDLMTLDAQKMYGPKGVGALFIKDNVKVEPQIVGGGQESGMRAGTENAPLIVGFAKAFEIAVKVKDREVKRLAELKDEFFAEAKKFVPSAIFNGPLSSCLPNNINISIPGKSGEFMTLQLDEEGIICSSASACGSNAGYSKVAYEIALKNGEDEKTARSRAESALRFSLGRDTNRRQIKYLLSILSKICK